VSAAGGRCRRCVNRLGEGDADGLCAECRAYAPPARDWERDVARAREEVARHRNAAGEYDLLVLASGGRDSSYLLYFLGKVCGARLVACHFDWGFTRPAAYRNMHRACETVGASLLIHRPWSPEETKRLHRAALRSGLGPCNFCVLTRVALQLQRAVDLRIPHTAWGMVPAQLVAGRFRDQLAMSLAQLQAVTRWMAKMFVAALALVMRDEPELHRRALADRPTVVRLAAQGGRDVDWGAVPRLFELSRYFDWTTMPQGDLEALLHREIGFEAAATTAIHSNCALEPIRGYRDGRLGLGVLTRQLSVPVREGLLARDEALRDLDRFGITKRPDEALAWYAREIEMPEAELEEALGRPAPAGFGYV
jgi:hypothetical protein